MGKCLRCGAKAGLFLNLCEKCQAENVKLKQGDAQRQQDLENQRKADDLKAAQEREAKRRRSVDEARTRILQRLNNGETVYLHDTVYTEVDSYILDRPLLGEFSFDTVRELGLAGWSVVGIIPRTMGYELFNNNGDGGTAYGGGLGGIIIGAYILVKKEIQGTPTEQKISELDEFLFRHIS